MQTETSQTSGAAPKPGKPQTQLSVLRTEQVGPRLVRVILGGPELEQFQPKPVTDMYVKLLFTRDGSPLAEKIDLAAARAELPAEEIPVTRTYTVRSVDQSAGELALDFVTHGDEGLAGPWAQRAQPGETLILQGPGGAYAPRPDADTHLLVGDESAVPAISAAIESLPADARGFVFIEVDDDASRLPLTRPERTIPAGLEVIWVHRGAAGHETGLLRDAVVARLGDEWPDGDLQVFAHGERESVKELRGLFRERGVPRESLSISAYWAEGRTEDRFQAEKREPIGKID